MILSLTQIALLVRDYDEAIAFYCGKLGFLIAEDTAMPGGKRWVRLETPAKRGTQLLLSRADSDDQRACVGNQAGGRVLFFLNTDDFDGDYTLFKSRGVEFAELPRTMPYGKVVVIKDLYGNRLDLIQP